MVTALIIGERVNELPKKPKAGVLYMLAEGDNSFSFHLSGNDGRLRYVGGDAAGNTSWHAAPTPPDGWLVCDGSTISRTSYAKLFTVIGTTYGSGDGTTTFKLPDFRGEFIRGWDGGRGVDGSRAFGSSQTGSAVYGAAYQAGGVGWGNSFYDADTSPGTNMDGTAPAINATKNYAARGGAGTATSVRDGGYVRPRNVAQLPIIKY